MKVDSRLGDSGGFKSQNCQQLLTGPPLKYCLQGSHQMNQGPRKKGMCKQVGRSAPVYLLPRWHRPTGLTTIIRQGREPYPPFNFLKPLKFVLGLPR